MESLARTVQAKNKNLTYACHVQIFVLVLFFCFVSAKPGDGVITTVEDYQALKAIKRELIDSRGVLRSWSGTRNGACSGTWQGINCVNGQVIVIQLPFKGLGGRISEQIGQLQALRWLSIHDNFLQGPVPNSLGFLCHLRGVYLFNNRLSGSIPASIGNSPSLQNLDLSNNLLTGTLSPNLVNSTRFYRLNLSYNAISGSIPNSFTNFPSLTFLALQHNNLSGSIPDAWGLNTNDSYQLRSLTLDHNLLSGNIPSSLSKLYNLKELLLSRNQIVGTIPDELGSLTKLQLLDLSGNAINGSFPTSFSNLTALVSLNLKANHLKNEILEVVSTLQNLTVLNLKSNEFDGDVPASIGKLSSLLQLDLSDNSFTGDIPDSISNLPNLTSFDVSNNNLSGEVPSKLLDKFNSTSFVGNIQLCGFSPTTHCPSPTPSSSSQATNHQKSRGHKTKDIILIAAGTLLLVLLVLCCILGCCLIRKKSNSKVSKESGLAGAKSVPAMGTKVESGDKSGKLVHFDGPFVFAADDLLSATAEIMQKSTYGTAYKATLEDNNKVVVKRLREKTAKGQKEFEAEVAALGKVRHQNILALRAYYMGPKGEKLLVFDYMSNGSLASFLHARGPDTTITWPTRMSIAMGMTRGLCFLHSKENIIHGNLTSSNIMLDEHNNPAIADVGLSRLMTNATNLDVIATAGTQGYCAPELLKLKNVTTKADVYSIGVIILELLTGKSPNEGREGVDLPQWVSSILKEEWTNEVFDLELMGDTSDVNEELFKTLQLAMHCVNSSPTARPEAREVLQKLEEIKPQLAAPSCASTPVKSHSFEIPTET
ncbi:hypothetical protein DCAR_0727514 [Daucus carota subsp. sativus]|uniref:Protein kinase domain-containing protein n=2 Tax=Daucus carota subsp. sativus TaxID=79200 RepID=A0AAF1B8R7_DAUCS|nr:hypothetical protein DCAR_0727514 [Daucus carota subsp. sativus]